MKNYLLTIALLIAVPTLVHIADKPRMEKLRTACQAELAGKPEIFKEDKDHRKFCEWKH